MRAEPSSRHYRIHLEKRTWQLEKLWTRISLKNKEVTQTVSTLAQGGTCLIRLTEMIGEGQIVFGRKNSPHISTGLLPFSKALLKLNLCEGSEIFSYCLSLFFTYFFLVYFWTVARMETDC